MPDPSAQTAHRRPSFPIPRHRLPSTGLISTFAFVLAFTSLIPYPGYPIGENTGLEAYDVISFALLPALLLMGVPKRQFAAVFLLLVPAAISASAATMNGHIQSMHTGIAVLIGSTLSFAPLLTAGIVARHECLPAILKGVCLATVIHVAAGAWQVYAFAHGFFPFLAILKNPGYTPLAPLADTWVQYIRRPFGLFPEPSAMAAALVPWLVVLTGLVLYPDISPIKPGRVLKALMLAALSGGVWLVIWSRSGFIVPMIVILAAVATPRAIKAISEFYIVRRLAFVAISVAAIWMVIVFAQSQFGNRLETSTAADPWAARRSSLEIGVRLPNTDLQTLMLGVGPGQSTVILQSDEGLDTIWSVTIRQYADTGMVGLFGMLGLAGMVTFAILRSSARLLGLAAAVSWLFGVTVVTSYGLNAVWFFLVTLLNWDLLFPVEQARAWLPAIQVSRMSTKGALA